MVELQQIILKFIYIKKKQQTNPNSQNNRVVVGVVAQLCLTLCDPMDCSPSGSSAHEVLQARILEWGTETT